MSSSHGRNQTHMCSCMCRWPHGPRHTRGRDAAQGPHLTQPPASGGGTASFRFSRVGGGLGPSPACAGCGSSSETDEVGELLGHFLPGPQGVVEVGHLPNSPDRGSSGCQWEEGAIPPAPPGARNRTRIQGPRLSRGQGSAQPLETSGASRLGRNLGWCPSGPQEPTPRENLSGCVAAGTA